MIEQEKERKKEETARNGEKKRDSRRKSIALR